MSTAEATAPANEAPPAEAATPASGKPKRKMSIKYKLLLIISSIAMMVFLRTGFVFVVMGMMPAIVAYYGDSSRKHYLFKTVFALNLSGVLPFVGRMLREGPQSSMQAIMQSLDTWVMIYGAAMSGYLLVTVTPILAHVLLGNFHVGQAERIRSILQKIESEWGDEVTKFSKKEEA
jgi:hypothetical protein